MWLLLALLSRWPSIDQNWAPLAMWCLLAAFCATTGIADALTGTVMLLSGQRATEVFRSPLLARSPIEFWSQRWNLMFRNSAYRLIFVPAGGRKRPGLGAALVFAFSAALHEYLVVATLEHTEGNMAAFFGLQWAATLVNQWARRRFGKRLPRALGMTLTWAWMVVTAPLFFAPILEIFPLDWLRSW
jgi:D-alanyl-lipoteichoic acid acyltransferase DltB (MBOAT superfamily)